MTEQVPVRRLLDTSVLVAALEKGHPHHVLARPYLQDAHEGTARLVVAAHALAETYSALTMLPVSPRISPAQAELLIEENVLNVAEVVSLDGADYQAAMKRMVAQGLVSGAIYDALHVRAAEKAACDELATFNGRDFRRMPPKAPCRLVIL